jgi:hypothetical protein
MEWMLLAGVLLGCVISYLLGRFFKKTLVFVLLFPVLGAYISFDNYAQANKGINKSLKPDFSSLQDWEFLIFSVLVFLFYSLPFLAYLIGLRSNLKRKSPRRWW